MYPKNIIVTLVFLIPILMFQTQIYAQSSNKAEDEIAVAAKKLLSEKFAEQQEYLNKTEFQQAPPPGFRVSDNLLINTASYDAKQRIKMFVAEMRAIIMVTAERIEKNYDFKIEIDKNQIKLSTQDQENIQHFSSAIEKTNISLKSYAIAVEFLIEFNSSLMDQANKEQEPNKKRYLFARQAALVHELCSVILSMLDSLSNEGIEEIRTFYSSEIDEINFLKDRMDKRISNAFDEADKKIAEEQSQRWLAALDQVKTEWQGMLDFIGKQEEWISNAKNAKKKFQLIQEDAKIQLGVLERIMVVTEVGKSIEALSRIIKIKNIPLLRLDAESALSLLQIHPLSLEFQELPPPSKSHELELDNILKN